MIKCITPTPRTWGRADVMTAFAEAKELGPWVSLHDPIEWIARDGILTTGAAVYESSTWKKYLIEEHELELMLQIDPFRTPREGTLGSKLPAGFQDRNFASSDVRIAYMAEVIRLVDLYKPQLLVLAMEINSYAAENPDDFDNFVSLFVTTKARVKRLFGFGSAAPKVGVSFQWEQMLKLGNQPGGWSALKAFVGKQDFIGISSYPQWRFGDAALIPKSYYRVPLKRVPIVFTELGWTAGEQQTKFIERLPELFKGASSLCAGVDVANWIALHDGAYGRPFDLMGLIGPDGPRPAYEAWRKL